MPRRPVAEFRSRIVRTVKVAVWENDKGGCSVTLTKSFKDSKSNEWQEQKMNLFPADMLAVAQELKKALAYIDVAPFGKEGGGASSVDEESGRDFNGSRGGSAEQAPPPGASFDDDDIPF